MDFKLNFLLIITKELSTVEIPQGWPALVNISVNKLDDKASKLTKTHQSHPSMFQWLQ